MRRPRFLNLFAGKTLRSGGDVFLETERLISKYSHIRSYVGCLSASDSNREDYLREEAAISLLGSDLEKLEVQLQRALRGADEDLLSEFVSFPDIESASYYVKRVWRNSRFTMSAPGGDSGLGTGSRRDKRLGADLRYRIFEDDI